MCVSRVIRNATPLLSAALSLLSALAICAENGPTVGWALDVTNSGILSQIDESAVKDLSMEVRDGVLRLARDPQKHPGAISFAIDFPRPINLRTYPGAALPPLQPDQERLPLRPLRWAMG